MHLDDLRPLLNAYLDDELSPAEARRVEETLAVDPAARAELAALEALDERLTAQLPARLLGQQLDPAGPDTARPASHADLAERIIARLPRTRRIPLPAGRTGWGIAAAGVAAGFLLAVLVVPGFEREPGLDTRSEPASTGGRVAVLVGAATWHPSPAGSAAKSPAEPASRRLHGGDLLTGSGTARTGAQDAIEIAIPGGSRWRMAGTAHLTLGPMRRQASARGGQLWLEVERGTRPFVLECPGGVVELDEGAISLAAEPGHLHLATLAGKARWQGGGASSQDGWVEVPAGQRLIVHWEPEPLGRETGERVATPDGPGRQDPGRQDPGHADPGTVDPRGLDPARRDSKRIVDGPRPDFYPLMHTGWMARILLASDNLGGEGVRMVQDLMRQLGPGPAGREALQRLIEPTGAPAVGLVMRLAVSFLEEDPALAPRLARAQAAEVVARGANPQLPEEVVARCFGIANDADPEVRGLLAKALASIAPDTVDPARLLSETDPAMRRKLLEDWLQAWRRAR